jgi:putative transposase
VKINKAFRYKLRPTAAQEQVFWQFAGAVRWVWNEMLAERKRVYEESGKGVSQYAQMRRLTALKQEPETEWLRTIHSQVLQEPIKQLQQAFVNFFEKRTRFPRFKKRKHTNQSFSYPQGVKVEDSRVYLPRIGWVRFRQSREVEGEIKRATVRRKASGWYISIVCEVEIEPEPVEATQSGMVGIDLGLSDFAVMSDGERVPNPRHLRRLERKLAREQRILSRRQRGSNRYRKQREKVARLHERVRDARADFLHKLSDRLVSENQGVVVEDLSIKGMARTRLAKSVHDAGWGEFLRQLEYKSRWQGKTFHQIDRWFPSSRIHNGCGIKNTISLSSRSFVCCGCGEIVDRDFNAAKNIKHQGLIDLGIVAVGHSETAQSDRLPNARGETVRLATASTSR